MNLVFLHLVSSDELFLDYNRKLYCKVCHEEEDFYPEESREEQYCDRCGKCVVHGKNVVLVITTECYDLEQM